MNQEQRIKACLDKSEIKDVVTASFFCRDSGPWDVLRDCFHPDAVVSTSWFTGSPAEFVKQSEKKLNAAHEKGERQKHVITNPFIRINGNRAVTEVDLILFQRRIVDDIKMDFTTWSRSLLLLEERNNEWRIIKRDNIYEKDRMDPYKPHEVPESFYASIDLEGFPPAIGYHCWRNAKSGSRPAPNIVTKGSESEQEVREAAEKWLAGE